MDKLELANTYYQALKNKDIDTIASCLHPEIVLISPLATEHGKEIALQAVEKFCSFFSELSVRSLCSSEATVMCAYNLQCKEPIGLCRAAAHLEFKEGLISTIELFYDARPFASFQKEIFSS